MKIRRMNSSELGLIFTIICLVIPCISSFAESQQIARPAPDAPNGSTSHASKVSAASASPASVEHWDILPLAGNGLQAYPLVVGETDTMPSFTRELMSVQWRPADPIDLYVIRPKGVVKPPVVLFLYGYPADSDRFRNDALCQNIVKHGFAAVGFVSALTGQRYHDRPMKEWFVSELQESLAMSVHDVQMVLNYLATRNDLDMNKVGIFGHGSGGTIAILSASVDPRIKAIDVMDPWGDWPVWLAKAPLIPDHERGDYLRPEFLAKVAPLDPIHFISQLKGRSFRIQENLFDLGMPEPVRKQIEAAAAGNAQIIEYHDTKEYSEKVASNGKMLEWMQAQFADPASSMTAKEFLQEAVNAENKAKQNQ
jgi:dienelactone hydrolase